MESVHFVPDQCANFASHFSSIKIFQIDLFYFASHFIRVQIFQICFSLKSEKFLFPPPHYNFGIVQWWFPNIPTLCRPSVNLPNLRFNKSELICNNIFLIFCSEPNYPTIEPPHHLAGQEVHGHHGHHGHH